ncbi:MAG: hypothetical protein Q9178_003842 [Gyalolechia marmorata]
MRSLLPFRDINVHASTSHYAFTSPSSPSAQTLVVERPSGDIRLNDGALLGAKRVSSIAGILGIIKLRLDKYIIVITKAQPMGRLKGHMVYKIIATEFLPLRERTLHDPDEDTYLNLLRTLLKTGPTYFSYSLDITNSFQRQADSNPSLPLWQRADDRFFWNKFIQSDLIDFATGATSGSGLRQHAHRESGADPFILPVMFGMMRITTTRIKSTPLTFVLITRRSRHRAGTRYLTRGMDEQGHVANFNETEQIVVLNDNTRGMGGMGVEAGMQNGAVGGFQGQDMQVMSYVQTRGSVPVYWAEISTLRYTPDLQIRGVETAAAAAKLHFDEQIRLYGDNYLVNLVNQKGREVKVKQAYEQMVRMLVSSPHEATQANHVTDEKFHVVEATQRNHEYDRLHYVYFDFHNETKGLRWHRAQLLLDQLKEGLVMGQYFRGVSMPGDSQGRLEVRNRQVAVVRTNCMDCLDRTNVVQTMLARWTLSRQLIDIGVLRPGESTDDDQAFKILFRNVWADNADVVSKSYSGTGALKTDFTRTGERTRAGMVQDVKNSITRYVKNNFSDGPRQDAFDLFLGAFLPDSSSIGSSLVFVDRRPVLIQAIPYVLAASVFMVLISSLPRSSSESAWWPLRLFAVLWLAIGVWCFRFIYGHGVLYVNWPKLNTPRWANEGYQETMGAIRQDTLIGPFVARHERGASNARVSHLEEAAPAFSNIDEEVSWPSILWALLPIIFNSMTQPTGSIAPGITAEQSFYLRASPFLCVVEAFAVLVQFVCLTIETWNPIKAIKCTSKAKFHYSTGVGTVRSQLQNLLENDVFRLILFTFGVLPQMVKLYSCTGIPTSQIWASLYLVSWAILELLVVLPARFGPFEGPEYQRSVRAYSIIVDNLVELICYIAIHYCDFMALHFLHVESDRDRQIHNPPSPWVDVLVAYASYMFLLFGRIAGPGPALSETFFYLFYLYFLAHFGLAESLWLVAIRLGRFISVIGIGGPIKEDQPRESLFKEYTRVGSVAFFLMHILTAVGSYRLKYDPAGTSRPAWTEYLG